MTIFTLAAEMSEAFTTLDRNGETIYVLRDGSPQWMTDVAYAAHGDMMPDDYRYEFIHDAVAALENSEDVDDARDSIEADVYTSDLTKWLHSRVDRIGYMDQAVDDGLYDGKDTCQHLMAAQWLEKTEVFDAVVVALENRLEELEEEADADDDEDGIACPECGEARFRAEDGGLACPNRCEQADDGDIDCADETLPDGFDVADETAGDLGDHYPE